MLAQSARLAIALAVLWCVLAVPAYLAAGPSALVGLAAAVLTCFLPGLVAIALCESPLGAGQPLAGVVVGMLLRVLCVLGAVFLVYQLYPQLSAMVYVAWLVPSYLVALAVETRGALKSVSEGVRQVPAGFPG